MDEAPVRALRRKPGASIRVAAETVAKGDAAALFSAGHTGATVMAAHAAFDMLEGVDRPALAATIPTRGRPAVLLDVGASVECRPAHLLQFAVMGSMYSRLAFGIEAPRVGLLSIGEEETKGNELTREAHRLLKASSLPFIGNVEARRVYSGEADVIVCDGFTGNVALKISEGVVEMVETLLGEELSSTITMRVGSLLTLRALRRFRRRVDYSEYGGAPLLGVNGIAIVGHGRSSAKAVRNAVAMAYRLAASRFIERVAQEIAAASASHPLP
jgi:glycerol-3-phosphate acyltransferase PlsX